MVTTTKLAMPLIDAAQAQKHITHNEAILKLDSLVQASVLDRDLTAPPGSPADGDAYIPASGATGAWAGKDLNIAVWQDGVWKFYARREGWFVFVVDEDIFVFWDGGAWQDFLKAIGALQNIAKLGVNAAADTTNRLSVETPSALFNAETNDINVTFNKIAATDDARLTFQTGFSTRVLLGTLGNDDFGISVSPDGSAFNQALSIDKDTGHIGLGGATADATNGVLARGTNFLFDKETDDCRFTFNKAATGDDVALTFQSNYSARALFGLLGNDDLTIKVAPDGSSYNTALIIDKDDGMASMPQHSKFSATSNFDNYIAANTWTKINFNTANHNDQADFDAGNAWFDAPADGYFSFGALVNFKENSTVPAFIAMKLYVGGVAVANTEQRYSGAIVTLETSLNIHAMLKLSSGDQVDVRVYFGTNDGYVEASTCAFWGAKIA